MYYVFRVRDGVWYVARSLSEARTKAAADRGLTLQEAESQAEGEGRCFWFPEMVGDLEMQALRMPASWGRTMTFQDALEKLRPTLTGPQKFFEVED